jgi:hypothetical protein
MFEAGSVLICREDYGTRAPNFTLRMHLQATGAPYPDVQQKAGKFQCGDCASSRLLQFLQNARSLRCTPAMEVGIENSAWTVSDLVNAA